MKHVTGKRNKKKEQPKIYDNPYAKKSLTAKERKKDNSGFAKELQLPSLVNNKESLKTDKKVSKKTLVRRKAANRIMFFLLLVIIFVGIFISVYLLFRVSDFRLEGDSPYPLETLIEKSQLQIDQNIFSYSKGLTEKKVSKELVMLEELEIRRRLPSTVVFITSPAIETYYLQTDGQYLILSQSLRALKSQDTAPIGLCELVGFSSGFKELGDILSIDSEDSSAALFDIINSLQQLQLYDIVLIDISNLLDIRLRYKDSFTLLLGTEVQLQYKLEMIKEVFNGLLETETGVLDASVIGKVTYKAGSIVPKQDTVQEEMQNIDMIEEEKIAE